MGLESPKWVKIGPGVSKMGEDGAWAFSEVDEDRTWALGKVGEKMT